VKGAYEDVGNHSHTVKLIYLGVVIYIISLAGRLVHAVERIADKFEDFQPPMES